MEKRRRNRMVKNPNGAGYVYSNDDNELESLEAQEASNREAKKKAEAAKNKKKEIEEI